VLAGRDASTESTAWAAASLRATASARPRDCRSGAGAGGGLGDLDGASGALSARGEVFGGGAGVFGSDVEGRGLGFGSDVEGNGLAFGSDVEGRGLDALGSDVEGRGLGVRGGSDDEEPDPFEGRGKTEL
jgi:hypothetical protein